MRNDRNPHARWLILNAIRGLSFGVQRRSLFHPEQGFVTPPMSAFQTGLSTHRFHARVCPHLIRRCPTCSCTAHSSPDLPRSPERAHRRKPTVETNIHVHDVKIAAAPILRSTEAHDLSRKGKCLFRNDKNCGILLTNTIRYSQSLLWVAPIFMLLKLKI